jgi:hypothetical protein
MGGSPASTNRRGPCVAVLPLQLLLRSTARRSRKRRQATLLPTPTRARSARRPSPLLLLLRVGCALLPPTPACSIPRGVTLLPRLLLLLRWVAPVALLVERPSWALAPRGACTSIATPWLLAAARRSAPCNSRRQAVGPPEAPSRSPIPPCLLLALLLTRRWAADRRRTLQLLLPGRPRTCCRCCCWRRWRLSRSAAAARGPITSWRGFRRQGRQLLFLLLLLLLLLYLLGRNCCRHCCCMSFEQVAEYVGCLLG